MLYEHERREGRHQVVTQLLVGAMLAIVVIMNVFVAGAWASDDLGLLVFFSVFAALLCGAAGWNLRSGVRKRFWLVMPGVIFGPQAPLVGIALFVAAPISWQYLLLAASAAMQLFAFAAGAFANGWSMRRRQTRHLHCSACGYPRTGLPRGAPCPECGDGQ